jgi:integrase
VLLQPACRRCKKTKVRTIHRQYIYILQNKKQEQKPEPIVVPVSSALDKVIKNIVGNRKQGIIFENLPADQTMNDYLKEIAKALGINKSISHKAGRHTFATYYLKKTKDLTSLKEILGHSELRETLIYAHVLDESKQEGITCFNSFSIYF